MNSCLDAFSTTFDAFTPMLNFHEQQDAQTEWRSCRVNSLTVAPLDASSPLSYSSFASKCSQEAVDDTKAGLGLAMGLYDGYYPIRDTAYKSLLDRAKISGSALPKLSRTVLAAVLNECLHLHSAEALLLLREGKISAVHSGDAVDYSVLPISELLGTLKTKLDARFPGNVFLAGYTDHAITYTCSAGTEIFDFIGQIFPDSESGSTGSAKLDAERDQLKAMGGMSYANVAKLLRLPDLEDMDYDPAGVYQKLTGIENSAASSQDCMAIVMDMVTEKVRELSKRDDASKQSGQTYTYIETDFIKALKNGYVVEIQEPSTIMQPGVLVGLNSLLEQDGTITLPTGEIIHRHPDAVVVVTTNISYEGCRDINQSVLDRMSLARDVELPTPEVMVQRAMSVTGATDEYMVSQMVSVVNDMAEYCRKNSITDGNVGMRSLIDWIISTEITGDPYESALYTIISKATSDEEDREALVSTALEPIFAPKRRKSAV